MRVGGKMCNHSITVLIDSGSTHNFLDPRAAWKATILIQSYPKFDVMVANRDWLLGEVSFVGVTLMVQGTLIKADFFLLTLGGCEVVLGAQWLRTLRPIV
ncbi:hypothetical protein CsSME_00008842 [Camellia sinensis var. sinensis]